MNTLRVTTVANSDVANSQETTTRKHSAIAPESKPANFRKKLASRQVPAAGGISEQVPKANCSICKEEKTNSDGYFYRGQFICDKHVWELADNGEFYCG